MVRGSVSSRRPVSFEKRLRMRPERKVKSHLEVLSKALYKSNAIAYEYSRAVSFYFCSDQLVK